MTAKAPTYPVATIAKLLLLTERRVQQLASEGILPRTSRGEYELAPTVQAYIRYLRNRGQDYDDEGSPVVTDKMRLLKAKAELAEIEAQQLRGDLIPVAEAAAADAVLFTALRDRVLGVASCSPLAMQAALQEGELALKRVLQSHLAAALDGFGSEPLEAEPVH